ncbi:mandelate racemase/muconate lactonizing enzyme family protein [Lacisediminimonas sp.]|uniref:mandelate racemase/muconate lactonizing enzyme family protein n=1 Tax=Lacisediminimonas sp. TaxID=3060582 RepID=UPI00271CA373|nr:mandelate racemase/muconate lactonizing enzyme family protein [Lacisediminimonas sp.]MDO8298992.1 mandelate racemase/muconate lactonizing enzyme family protein [Lacisediminimonas sp.]
MTQEHDHAAPASPVPVPAAPALPDAASTMCIANVEAFVFRAPCAMPVRTAFGVMHDRPAVLVRVRDTDGVEGWGEVWCNFPGVGAEHRARLLASVLAPMLQGAQIAQPAQATAELERRTAILAIQCGEPGPLAQVLAGVDQALWDLAARRARLPLWRLLGGSSPTIGAYASGLGPAGATQAALAHQAMGYRAFKLKVGFNPQDDSDNLRALRLALGDDARLMVDANQGWSREQALQACPRLAESGLDWIEEPLRADAPQAHWREVATSTTVALAAGENIMGIDHFGQAIASGQLGVLQPDVAKWGGISHCLPVAQMALAAGLRYCPHYLGAGVGLAMSAHLLAAAGGDGMLEVDSNPNPLREMLWPTLAGLRDGRISLGEEAGIGAPPELGALEEFAVPFGY